MNAKRKRKRDDGDEILEIAREVEGRKKSAKVGQGEGGGQEAVVLKGTGKAIQKVLELGLWFQQREEYGVVLRTGSVVAIDDVCVDDVVTIGWENKHSGSREGDPEDDVEAEVHAGAGGKDNDGVDVDASEAAGTKDTGGGDAREKQKHASTSNAFTAEEKQAETIPETRIRYTSVLEVAVSLR